MLKLKRLHIINHICFQPGRRWIGSDLRTCDQRTVFGIEYRWYLICKRDIQQNSPRLLTIRNLIHRTNFCWNRIKRLNLNEMRMTQPYLCIEILVEQVVHSATCSFHKNTPYTKQSDKLEVWDSSRLSCQAEWPEPEVTQRISGCHSDRQA